MRPMKFYIIDTSTKENNMTEIFTFTAHRTDGSKFFFEATDFASAWKFVHSCNEPTVVILEQPDAPH
jgi:hypothetical protein